MEIILGFLFGISTVGICFFFYMCIRNNRVYSVRMKTLNDERFSWEERKQRYNNLPDYESMEWQLFRWNWDDYLEKPRQEKS